jgi:hypothetical protein
LLFHSPAKAKPPVLIPPQWPTQNHRMLLW